MVINGGDLVAHNVTVDGAVRAGLIAAVDGVASVQDVTIRNVTGSSDGTWGRGIYIQGIAPGAYLNMENIVVENVHETGIFIQDLSSADLQNVTIATVSSHETTDGENMGGDGMVVVQTSAEEVIDPSVVSVQLLGTNSFTGIDRAGVIAHGSHLQMTVPMAIEAGEVRDGMPIFTQGDGKIDFVPTAGSDGGTSEALIAPECGEEDSYHLDCDGFDFSSPL